MSPGIRILVVDDDAGVRQLLTLCLSQEGYAVTEAEQGQAALELLAATPFDLVISDVRMPVMDGLDLLDGIRARHIRVDVLMLTACDDVPMAVSAMKLGALDYILKPFDLDDLRGRIQQALSRRVVGVEQETPSEAPRAEELRTALDEQTRQMLRMLRQMDEASEGMLEALVTALDAREHETHSHSQRVARFAVHLAQALGLGGPFLTVLWRGALLHDIGKIGVPDRILMKPGTLSAEEWAEMRMHPIIGARILESIEVLRPAAEIVLCHHENFDGSGYPRGLGGADIPLGARIFSVVDSFDAMISPRSYRTRLSLPAAREEMLRCSGSQFDPEIVGRFLSVPPEFWAEAHA